MQSDTGKFKVSYINECVCTKTNEMCLFETMNFEWSHCDLSGWMID